MKFSLSWIKDHLDTDASGAEIADRLVMLGHDVEGVEDRAAALAGFVVARVLSVSFIAALSGSRAEARASGSA